MSIFLFFDQKQNICVSFCYIRLLNLRFQQFQYSTTLDIDMILTCSCHQFEALDVALKMVYLTLYEKIAICD